MTDIGMLERRFGVPGVVRVEPGQGALPKVVISSPLAAAELYLHGAHVTHFQPRGAQPVLFMSEASAFQDGKPIRGGVPVIFPWFGARAGAPESPAHGFARLETWELESREVRPDGTVEIALGLSAGPDSLRLWPHPFQLRLFVRVSRSLEILLEVGAPPGGPALPPFEEALHTYLHVGDVRQISIEGLAQTAYLDKVDGLRSKIQPPESIRITGETDRIYLETAAACVVHDPVLERDLRVEKESSRTTVVWNPWIEKARKMADFGDDEWPEMICIEAANVGEASIRVEPSRVHRMLTRISLASG